MSFPNSTEEIDISMISEGFDNLPEEVQDFLISVKRDREISDKQKSAGFGYWLDNCGDDEWYCTHCLQSHCEKRKWYGW